MAKPKNPKKVSAGRRSRRKGSTFERYCCRLLSKWWFPDKDFNGISADKLPFFRSPNSGGWATKRKFHRNERIDAMSGDIVCPDNFPYQPEMKNREGWTFEQYFRDNPGFVLWEWWEQTVEQAERAGKKPLLLFTKNRSPVFYAIDDFHILQTFQCKSTLLWKPGMRLSVGLLDDLTSRITKKELLSA